MYDFITLLPNSAGSVLRVDVAGQHTDSYIFSKNSRHDSEKKYYNNVMRAYHTNVMIQKQHQ